MATKHKKPKFLAKFQNYEQTLVIILLVALAFLLVNYSPASITGAATKTTHEVSTAFPIDAWEYTGWGKCSGQSGTWTHVNDYCKSKGYTGALSANENPCYHVWSNSRYGWDGKSPMSKGKQTYSGYAFTKVKCYSSAAETQCDPACPSGYTCESDKVCRKNGKTCTETGDNKIDYYYKGTVIDTQTSWNGYKWTDACDGDTLIEFFCSTSDYDNVALIKHVCAYGCENGVCKQEQESEPLDVQEPDDLDTDDYADYDEIEQEGVDLAECDTPCPSGYNCDVDEKCRKGGKTCTETGDSGKDFYKKGTVTDPHPGGTWRGTQWTDACTGDKLTEFYCSADNVALNYKTCPYGCANGACKEEEQQFYDLYDCDPACPSGYTCESDEVCRKNGKTCTETGDVGEDYYKKGTVVDTQTSWNGYSWTDTCIGNKLTEFYCKYDDVNLNYKTCEYGCEYGKCKSSGTRGPAEEEETMQEESTATCTDPDGKEGYTTKTSVTTVSGSSATDKCEKDYTDWPFLNYPRANIQGDEYVVEFYCNQWTSQVQAWFHNCADENGVCEDGKCVEGHCPAGYTLESDGICKSHGKTCTDPDDAYGKRVKGTVTDTQTSWTGESWTDYCINSRKVREYYCVNDDVEYFDWSCGIHNCEAGACVEDPCVLSECPEGFNECGPDNLCRKDGKKCVNFDDDGKDYYKKGYVIDTEHRAENPSEDKFVDKCVGNKLVENYCHEWSDTWNEEHYICPYKCEDGACVKSPCSPECPEGFKCDGADNKCKKDGLTCYDSDGGKDIGKRGKVTDTGQLDAIGGYKVGEDLCFDSERLGEFYCNENNRLRWEEYVCIGGCEDGKCRCDCPEGYNECDSNNVCKRDGKTCYDTDGGKDYYTKATITDTKVTSYDAWESFKQTDACETGNPNNLLEFYCYNDDMFSEEFLCAYGCRDGACRESLECSGRARSCSSYTVDKCKKHPGCHEAWFLWWGWCEGSPKSCSRYTTESSCKAEGCTWS